MSAHKLREGSRAIRKLLSMQVYRHLNTDDYTLIANECDFHKFLKNLNLSNEHLSEKEKTLQDSSAFTQIKVSDDAIRWVTESVTTLKNVIKPFCIRPTNNSQKTTERGKDNSERAKYNRQAGLVLTSEVKKTHQFETFESDASSKSAKIIHEQKAPSFQDYPEVDKEERSDDLEDEQITDNILLPSTPPCELHNPIASLINGQALQPHIALHNQQLRPRAISSETQQILRHINWTSQGIQNGVLILSTNHVQETLKTFLLLMTGRDIHKIETEGFFLKEDSAFIDTENKVMKLGFPQYQHREVLSHRDIYVESEPETLTLKFPMEIADIICPLVDYLYGHLPHNDSAISLKSSRGKNDKSFKDFPLEKYSGFVQRNYSIICNDSWLLSVFTWQMSGLQNTQKHYASFRQRDAQKIFEQHCESFLQIKISTVVFSNRKNQRIGSPYFLNNRNYAKITKWLWSHARHLQSPLRYQSVDLDVLKFQFNCLAFWIDSACSFAGATRNIIDPLVDVNLISEDGLYRINDKNKFDGFNTRVVYIPPKLKKKLYEYNKIRQKILIYLKKQKKKCYQADKKVTDSGGLFFFQTLKNGKLKIVPFTRSRCRDEIYQQARSKTITESLPDHLVAYDYLRALKTNVNRHYLRGRLLELNVPGNIIDALLGHWHAGTQPWGKMSLFDTNTFLETLKTHIPMILKELGFDFDEYE